MKKWMKVCLITGLSCTAIGAALCGIGSVSGGKKYVRTADLNRFDISDTSDKTDLSVLPKTQIEDYRNLNIDLDMLDLQIVCSDDDHFYISYEAQTKDKKSAVAYSVEEDTLTVEEGRSVKGSYMQIDINFLSDLLDKELEVQQKNLVTLYIPKDTDIENLKLNSDRSEISLSSVDVKSGSIQTSSGDVIVKDSVFEHVSLDSDMGDIVIRNCKLNGCDFSSDSGDFTFTDVTLKGDTEITSDMGEINLTSPAEILTKLTIQVTTDDGDIDVSDQLNGKVKEDEMESTQTFKQKNGQSKDSLTIETDSGDISLECE